MVNFLSRFFPTPEYLKTPAIGLDISDHSIHFAELLPKEGQYVLGRFGEKRIPSGVMEAGQIKDQVRLRKILSDLHNEQKFSFINVSLPEEQGYLVRVTTPKVKKSELRDSILGQLEEYIPLRAEEAVFDYEIISETERNYELEISAIPRSLSESYFKLFEGTGFTPLNFEIEAQAIARAVYSRGDKSTKMIIDFGETRTGLSVVSQGVVMFTSTIDIGGRVLNEALQKTFNINPEEAERIKKEYGLTRELGAGKDFFLALTHPITALKDEINRHFVYWHTYPTPGERDRKRIESIVLCGGESNLLGLADFLAANLKVPVKTANVWTNINSFENYIPEISEKDSLRYATAIGLALGSIIKND